MGTREERINSEVSRLMRAKQEGSFQDLNSELAKKRLEWYSREGKRLRLKGSEVRRAYEMFLLSYLGLDPGEVPVVYEDERKITWRSYNLCPTLEACRSLGLDTKEICRESQEEPVQALISQLNPCLVFRRNYDSIRPYAPYCEESIELK
jgi:hypothetical protein